MLNNQSLQSSSVLERLNALGVACMATDASARPGIDAVVSYVTDAMYQVGPLNTMCLNVACTPHLSNSHRHGHPTMLLVC